MWGNAALAVFNMLPFGPLDGKKIKKWSETMFWFWLIVTGSLIWFNINYLPALL
jgi:Zn-dependent protease